MNYIQSRNHVWNHSQKSLPAMVNNGDQRLEIAEEMDYIENNMVQATDVVQL